jgi:hypothetical protein
MVETVDSEKVGWHLVVVVVPPQTRSCHACFQLEDKPTGVFDALQLANKLDNAVSGADREPLNVMVQVPNSYYAAPVPG